MVGHLRNRHRHALLERPMGQWGRVHQVVVHCWDLPHIALGEWEVLLLLGWPKDPKMLLLLLLP